MRRGLLFLTLLLVGFCLLSDLRSNGVSKATSSDGDDFVPSEVVVKLVSAADLPAIASRYALDPTPIDQFGSRPIYRLRIKDSASVEKRVEALSSDSRVVFAEPMISCSEDLGGLLVYPAA